jgi:hypothetical protein
MVENEETKAEGMEADVGRLVIFWVLGKGLSLGIILIEDTHSKGARDRSPIKMRLRKAPQHRFGGSAFPPVVFRRGIKFSRSRSRKC